MDLKKINNSYLVIDKNINTVVNNYYTYIFSLLDCEKTSIVLDIICKYWQHELEMIISKIANR